MRKPRIEQVANQLNSVAIHLLRTLRAQDDPQGVGPAQRSALSVIVLGGPTSLKELADAEQVRPQTMSRIVDALVREGLAMRKVNEEDRRLIVISPTANGVRTMRKGRDRRVRRLASLLEGLDNAEVEHLEKAAEILSNIFGGPH